MNGQSAFTALITSLVQKVLIIGFTALATWLGVQLDYGAVVAVLAPLIATVIWGLWQKLAAHKVAVAATNAGINVQAVAKSSLAVVASTRDPTTIQTPQK